MIPYPPDKLRGEDEQIPLNVQEQVPQEAGDDATPPEEEVTPAPSEEEAIPPSNEATFGSSGTPTSETLSSEIDASQTSGSSSVIILSSSTTGQSSSDFINATNEGNDANLLTSPEPNTSSTLAESATVQVLETMGEEEEQGDHA